MGMRLGILGYPLAHTKSPAMQKAGLDYLGIEGEYQKYEADPVNFSRELSRLLTSLNGFNVTIPYKEKVVKYLNNRNPLVERIGATNTVVVNEGIITGYNTDYYGFKTSLQNVAGDSLKGKNVSLIGAGGAAKAVLAALEDLEVEQINIYVRNLQKVKTSLKKLNNLVVNVALLDEEVNFANTDLLINSTPVGQGRLSTSMPIDVEQVLSLPEHAIVYDLIYEDTLLLQEAQRHKLKTINGSKMLILQGAKALSLWTGQKVTDGLVEAMSSAFYAAA